MRRMSQLTPRLTPELGMCLSNAIHEDVFMPTDVRDRSATENRVDYAPAAAGARLRNWAVAGVASLGIWAAIFWAVSELL